MNSISLISLSLTMLVFTASPGPGVFATVARSLSSGFRPALAFIAGIVAGDTIYLMLAIFGLSVVAEAMGEMFMIIKILGGIYLVWLGVKMWLSKAQEPEEIQKTKPRSWYGNFIGGFLITLSNPKVILFYCGFLPTFLGLSSLNIIDIVIVSVIIAGVLSLVLSTYALLASSARHLFSNKNSGKLLNQTAGGIMVATGVTITLRS